MMRAGGGRGLRQLINSLKQPRLASVLVIYFLFIVAFSIMTTSFSLYTMFRFGYDAKHTGYLFAYVGLIAVIIQGGLIGRLVKRFGELPLVILGAFCFAISLFAVPFVGPAAGGLAGFWQPCGNRRGQSRRGCAQLPSQPGSPGRHSYGHLLP